MGIARPRLAQGGGGRRGPRLAVGRVVRPPRPWRCGVGPRVVVRAFLLFFGFSSFRGWPGGLGRSLGWRLPLVAGFLWGCVVAFSLVGSRSLVVSRGSLVAPLSAPWWRRLVGSALGAGACRWRVRASRRSFSGAVVVAGFGSAASASAFAAAWSSWVGFPLAVRRFRGAAGPVFGVSVPVAVSPGLRLAVPASLPRPVGWVA